jgi:hypothetical protein
MAKVYYGADKRKMAKMIYRSALMMIFCLGLFSLSTSFINFSFSQVSFAQLSSSPETPLSQEEVPGTNELVELEAAKQQYLSVWNNTGFTSQFDTFIEEGSALGYGIYREHVPANVFRPGETIVLYVEPVGFGHHQQIVDDAGNTLYSIDLAADIILSDVNGNELATIEDLPISDLVSHRQNTELHLTLTLTQDSPFPAGDYIVSYIVYDQVTGQSFQMDREITIDGDGVSNTI